MKDKETMPDRHSYEGAEILEYWRVVRKRWIFITILSVTTVLSTALYSLFMTDVYQSTAVIIPISKENERDKLAIFTQQIGGLQGLPMPSSTSSSEIINLLNSNILRKKVIGDYNLLPVLFHERWDAKKKDWKREGKGGFVLQALGAGLINTINPLRKKAPDQEIPTMWDGVRRLNSIVRVKNNPKDNTITVSAEYYDPELSSKLASYFLSTLTEHMSGEANRVANSTRRYLEGQLQNTADPYIRQKIYNLIAQQMEISMMSEVKENFVFKVIDPPQTPDRKIRPRRLRMVLVSLVFALFASVILSFFLDYSGRVKGKRR